MALYGAPVSRLRKGRRDHAADAARINAPCIQVLGRRALKHPVTERLCVRRTYASWRVQTSCSRVIPLVLRVQLGTEGLIVA